MIEVVNFPLDTIDVRFSKGIPMETKYTPFIADKLLYCNAVHCQTQYILLYCIQ